MNVGFLKLRLLFFFLILLSTGLKAQPYRFIYIQTDNKQPFYVKVDKKIIRPVASGYIIISKLTDSLYKLSIGFPKNNWPEQHVTIAVEKVDVGFILKNFGDKGWGLVNLQTLEVLMCEMNSAEIKVKETELSGDEFARILSSVVNDPSINQVARVNNTVDNKIEVKPVDIVEAKPVLSDEIKHVSENRKVGIAKLFYDSTAEGISMNYLDIANEETDTVSVFIPISKSVVIIELEKPIELPNTGQVKDEKKDKEPGFIDMELPNPNLNTDSGLKKTVDIVITKKRSVDKKLINARCKKTATYKDFLKLRKQMAESKNENGMIKAAHKQFITVCFTTEQIKNLGTLFIKEEERYKFYVGAFPFVSDSHNYASLQDQLTDNYYISRFKAMVNK